MKNILKTLGILVVGFFALFGLGAFLLTMILAVGLSQFSGKSAEPTPVVAQDLDNTFVKIEVKGPITSVSADPRDEFFNELFGEPRVTHVGDLIKVLERLAKISAFTVSLWKLKSPK